METPSADALDNALQHLTSVTYRSVSDGTLLSRSRTLVLLLLSTVQRGKISPQKWSIIIPANGATRNILRLRMCRSVSDGTFSWRSCTVMLLLHSTA